MATLKEKKPAILPLNTIWFLWTAKSTSVGAFWDTCKRNTQPLRGLSVSYKARQHHYQYDPLACTCTGRIYLVKDCGKK